MCDKKITPLKNSVLFKPICSQCKGSITSESAKILSNYFFEILALLITSLDAQQNCILQKGPHVAI